MKEEFTQNTKEVVGARIKEIRKTLNIKGKDFASRLNVSGPSVSEMEKGKYYPNFEFIYNIAREYHVNIYFLLFGEGNMFIEPGRISEVGLLEELAGNNENVRRFLKYFERSEIIRYFILSQFKSKMIADRDMIEKELEEF